MRRTARITSGGTPLAARSFALSVIVIGLHPAFASCVDDFGKHIEPPSTLPKAPAPILSPLVLDLPFGKFKWGTDAYRDGSGNWWVDDVIWNDPGGPPLAVSWAKGDIHRAISFPLTAGESQCNTHFVSTGVPEPDTDAPIIYHANREQDAAVYSGANFAKDNSNGTPSKKNTDTRIETTITRPNGTKDPIEFELKTRSTESAIVVTLQTRGNFTIAIPSLSSMYGANYTSKIAEDFSRQDFSIQRDQFNKIAGKDVLPDFYWYEPKRPEIEGTDTFFIRSSEKGNKAVTELSLDGLKTSEKVGQLLIFSDELKPVLIVDANFIVPLWEK